MGQSEIPDQEAWDAWLPDELAKRLSGVDRPWCVAGGWALDLWHGRVTREHHDLEFTVLRQDFDRFRRALSSGSKAPLWPAGPSPPCGEGTRGDLPFQSKSALHAGLAFYTVSSGVFGPLHSDADSDPSVGQIWCWDIAARCWRVDIMIEPGTPETWICKRDHAITRTRSDVVRRSSDGIPYLGPAAVLLLKAKHQRPKDEGDFDIALPKLNEG